MVYGGVHLAAERGQGPEALELVEPQAAGITAVSTTCGVGERLGGQTHCLLSTLAASSVCVTELAG